jgi:hypothetical protein
MKESLIILGLGLLIISVGLAIGLFAPVSTIILSQMVLTISFSMLLAGTMLAQDGLVQCLIQCIRKVAPNNPTIPTTDNQRKIPPIAIGLGLFAAGLAAGALGLFAPLLVGVGMLICTIGIWLTMQGLVQCFKKKLDNNSTLKSDDLPNESQETTELAKNNDQNNTKNLNKTVEQEARRKILADAVEKHHNYQNNVLRDKAQGHRSCWSSLYDKFSLNGRRKILAAAAEGRRHDTNQNDFNQDIGHKPSNV